MGDARFLGNEQRRRMGAESSHLSMAHADPVVTEGAKDDEQPNKPVATPEDMRRFWE